MTYSITNPIAGYQAIADTSTTQNHPLGTIVTAKDDTYGVGEFIYLKGVASTVIGDAVFYTLGASAQTGVVGTTARVTASANGHLGIAMSANVASQYGWYQISGLAVANTPNTVVAAAAVYVISTGALDDAVTSTDLVSNANFATADGTPAAGKALVNIDRPFVA